jgi:multicomponent Na+:H+ antiporter subunit F
MIAVIAAIGVGATLALSLVRLFAGPTLYDRALIASSVVVKAALLCAAVSVALGRTEGVDVALVLMLAAFALGAATLKFFRARTFQAPMAREEGS